TSGQNVAQPSMMWHMGWAMRRSLARWTFCVSSIERSRRNRVDQRASKGGVVLRVRPEPEMKEAAILGRGIANEEFCAGIGSFDRLELEAFTGPGALGGRLAVGPEAWRVSSVDAGKYRAL